MIRLEEFQRVLGMTALENVSIRDTEDILAKIDRAPALACQLLNPERVTGKDHVQLAVLNALRAFKNSRNISRQLSIEILLYASGQRQIEKALGMLGIKAGMQRVLAVAVGETDEEVKELLNAVRGLLGGQASDEMMEQWSEEKAWKILEAYGISPDEVRAARRADEPIQDLITKILAERMALLSML